MIKSMKIIFSALLACAMLVSCAPSAEDLIEEYNETASEYAKAKIEGEESRCEKLLKRMEKLNRQIIELAEKETKKAIRKADKATQEAMDKVEKYIPFN